MKNCKSCGAQISDDAEFCSNCGEKVVEAVEVVNEEKFFNKGSNIKERNIALAIILSIITCGIYSIVWMIKINDEALELSKEKGQSGIIVFLLSLITCGIYGYYWAYKMGICVDKIKNNSNGNTGILYLILALLGFNIINMALLQDVINNNVN